MTDYRRDAERFRLSAPSAKDYRPFDPIGQEGPMFSRAWVLSFVD